MSDAGETTLTIEIRDKYDCTHKRDIVKAPYETDAQFFERAQRMLDELRKETP